MSPIRLVGHLLLWAGFLYGAFVAVERTDVEDNPWATIDWAPYGGAILVSVVGVVLLRGTAKRGRTDGDDHAASAEQLAATLERLRGQLAEWRQESEQHPLRDAHHRIDDHLSDDLANFADRRESLAGAFGLDHYAQIMTEFALAERTINRIWSASADGYIDEVQDCLIRAIEHLDAAIARLQAAQSEVP